MSNHPLMSLTESAFWIALGRRYPQICRLRRSPIVAPRSKNLQEDRTMADERVKGPASYFPSIEKRYGRPIAEWQALVRGRYPGRHMELVAMLKDEHGMGHGHANAIVAHTLAEDRG